MGTYSISFTSLRLTFNHSLCSCTHCDTESESYPSPSNLPTVQHNTTQHIMSASIPTSPPPGKDPPAPSNHTNPGTKAASDKENKSPSAAHKSPSSANIDADSKAMPPPPIPSTKPRPVITAQHPSSSNTNTNISFSPSLTQSTSQNTAVQDQP